MPEIGGTEASARLRRAGYSGYIIGMTGDPAGCEDRQRFEASGVDLVVDKDTAGVERLRALLTEAARRSYPSPRRRENHRREASPQCNRLMTQRHCVLLACAISMSSSAASASRVREPPWRACIRRPEIDTAHMIQTSKLSHRDWRQPSGIN